MGSFVLGSRPVQKIFANFVEPPLSGKKISLRLEVSIPRHFAFAIHDLSWPVISRSIQPTDFIPFFGKYWIALTRRAIAGPLLELAPATNGVGKAYG